MTKQEIIIEIENNHLLLCVPQVSKVFVGDDIYIGHFHTFDDSDELRKEGKYRFFKANDQQLFFADQSKRGKTNTKYSTIISADDIVKIEITDGRKR